MTKIRMKCNDGKFYLSKDKYASLFRFKCYIFFHKWLNVEQLGVLIPISGQIKTKTIIFIEKYKESKGE